MTPDDLRNGDVLVENGPGLGLSIARGGGSLFEPLYAGSIVEWCRWWERNASIAGAPEGAPEAFRELGDRLAQKEDGNV